MGKKTLELLFCNIIVFASALLIFSISFSMMPDFTQGLAALGAKKEDFGLLLRFITEYPMAVFAFPLLLSIAMMFVPYVNIKYRHLCYAGFFALTNLYFFILIGMLIWHICACSPYHGYR